jgi:hypothetical protein
VDLRERFLAMVIANEGSEKLFRRSGDGSWPLNNFREFRHSDDNMRGSAYLRIRAFAVACAMFSPGTISAHLGLLPVS